MLTQSQLIQQLTTTIGKSKVIELSKILKDQQFNLRYLIDITFNKDKDIAFRASWLLENVFLKNPQAYLNDLDYLIQCFINVSYPSCQRHYAKIMMHITDPKAPAAVQLKLKEIDLEKVMEHLFDWMIDPKVKIAVKVFSSEALFNMRYQYSWITEELADQIKYLMSNGTAAIQSRGKKLLKQLGN
ncbi:MAG: hypothetical protein JWQ06_2494 [Mucilaginibacter sp.]|nr:hypothetical protein [Mucilaginibacter sp.]